MKPNTLTRSGSLSGFITWPDVSQQPTFVIALHLMLPPKEVWLKYRDALRAQSFQTFTTSLFESIWVSDLIGELLEGRGSLFMKFSFLRHEATKLGPQRIMVKSSDVR